MLFFSMFLYARANLMYCSEVADASMSKVVLTLVDEKKYLDYIRGFRYFLLTNLTIIVYFIF